MLLCAFLGPSPPSTLLALCCAGAIGPSTACYQFLPFIGHFGVEDCLFLDIHTPATPCQPEGCETARPKLPVLVFIHGGGFVYGDKSQAFFYDGASLARDRNMVVVSIQYRIGAMGFMAHKDQPPSELNAGLLDQRVALQWLQDNIEHFGETVAGRPCLLLLVVLPLTTLTTMATAVLPPMIRWGQVSSGVEWSLCRRHFGLRAPRISPEPVTFSFGRHAEWSVR